MNRRVLLCRAAVSGAVLLIPPVFLTGCSDTTELLNTVISAVDGVLAVAEPGAAWAVSLQKALSALQSAETTWVAGGPVQVVIDALNTIMAVTAVIPLTAAYSPLIDVLVAGIEAVLEVLQPTTATANVASRAVGPNPHMGRATIKPHWFESKVAAFKRQWDAVVDTNPALAKARI